MQYVRLLTFRLSGTEQNIVQFRVERFGVDRFGEIVFRTRFHRTDGRRHLRVLRHNDKRNPAFILLHPLQQFDSVAVGQPQIRQNHIDFFVRYDPAGVRGGYGARYLQPLPFQPVFQRTGKHDIILDNQYTAHTRTSFARSAACSANRFPAARMRSPAARIASSVVSSSDKSCRNAFSGVSIRNSSHNESR